MTLLTHPKSFQELLTYEDGTENVYELTEGELVEVASESFQNRKIARRLAQHLEKFIDFDLIQLWGLNIEVAPLIGMPVNRLPDLMVLQPDHSELLSNENGITSAMPPPLLIAEVVSPYPNGLHENFTRDYCDKPQQYAIRGVPEYWIIDPQRGHIEVNWDPDQSQRRYLMKETFQGVDRMRSQLAKLKELEITAEEVLNPNPIASNQVGDTF